MLYENHIKIKMPLSPLSIEQLNSYHSELNYSICENLFTDKCKKNLDHCLLTGEYRGVAHNNCNINH